MHYQEIRIETNWRLCRGLQKKVSQQKFVLTSSGFEPRSFCSASQCYCTSRIKFCGNKKEGKGEIPSRGKIKWSSNIKAIKIRSFEAADFRRFCLKISIKISAETKSEFFFEKKKFCAKFFSVGFKSRSLKPKSVKNRRNFRSRRTKQFFFFDSWRFRWHKEWIGRDLIVCLH